MKAEFHTVFCRSALEFPYAPRRSSVLLAVVSTLHSATSSVRLGICMRDSNKPLSGTITSAVFSNESHTQLAVGKKCYSPPTFSCTALAKFPQTTCGLRYTIPVVFSCSNGSSDHLIFSREHKRNSESMCNKPTPGLSITRMGSTSAGGASVSLSHSLSTTCTRPARFLLWYDATPRRLCPRLPQ